VHRREPATEIADIRGLRIRPFQPWIPMMGKEWCQRMNQAVLTRKKPCCRAGKVVYQDHHSTFHSSVKDALFDWCCFYYSIRNRLGALLEGLFARNEEGQLLFLLLLLLHMKWPGLRSIDRSSVFERIKYKPVTWVKLTGAWKQMKTFWPVYERLCKGDDIEDYTHIRRYEVSYRGNTWYRSCSIDWYCFHYFVRNHWV